MILYRLGLKKFIEYFQLDKLFRKEKRRYVPLHKKPKEIYKTKLKANKKLDLFISFLLSLIGALVCITLPYALLEDAIEPLRDRNMMQLYRIAVKVEKYLVMIDRMIIALSIILVYVTIVTITDAIKNTDISMSPWVERGKYNLPVNAQKAMSKRYEIKYRFRNY